jgi:uncharacterized protein (DUF779 family)
MEPTGRISATTEALDAIERLTAKHGALMLFQSGGCCDGSAPLCLHDGELMTGPNDRLLGRLGGMPVYIDEEQDRRWNHPRFVLDVAPGPASGFSLEGLDGIHFITRSPSRGRSPSTASSSSRSSADRAAAGADPHAASGARPASRL